MNLDSPNPQCKYVFWVGTMFSFLLLIGCQTVNLVNNSDQLKLNSNKVVKSKQRQAYIAKPHIGIRRVWINNSISPIDVKKQSLYCVVTNKKLKKIVAIEMDSDTVNYDEKIHFIGNIMNYDGSDKRSISFFLPLRDISKLEFVEKSNNIILQDESENKEVPFFGRNNSLSDSLKWQRVQFTEFNEMSIANDNVVTYQGKFENLNGEEFEFVAVNDPIFILFVGVALVAAAVAAPYIYLDEKNKCILSCAGDKRTGKKKQFDNISIIIPKFKWQCMCK